MDREAMTSHLILYDGVCGLCSRVTLFILPRDRRGIFRFAAIQSATVPADIAARRARLGLQSDRDESLQNLWALRHVHDSQPRLPEPLCGYMNGNPLHSSNA